MSPLTHIHVWCECRLKANWFACVAFRQNDCTSAPRLVTCEFVVFLLVFFSLLFLGFTSWRDESVIRMVFFLERICLEESVNALVDVDVFERSWCLSIRGVCSGAFQMENWNNSQCVCVMSFNDRLSFHPHVFSCACPWFAWECARGRTCTFWAYAKHIMAIKTHEDLNPVQKNAHSPNALNQGERGKKGERVWKRKHFEGWRNHETMEMKGKKQGDNIQIKIRNKTRLNPKHDEKLQIIRTIRIIESTAPPTHSLSLSRTSTKTNTHARSLSFALHCIYMFGSLLVFLSCAHRS